jgi:hypothetical protein
MDTDIKGYNMEFRKLVKSVFIPAMVIALGVVSVNAQHHDACEIEHETAHKSEKVQSPAGVMGDHVHHKGSWMFSYTYMGMMMDEMIEGRSQVDHTSLMASYDMIPEQMFMQMHMLGAMYSVSDKITLMAMFPFLQKSMNHSMMGHHHSNMMSSGLGDVRVSFLTPIFKSEKQSLILNAGLSVPTGSTNMSSTNMSGDEFKMGYGMQMGSGTPDVIAALSYNGGRTKLGYGAQASGVLRLGENQSGYRQGNQIENSIWIGTNVMKRTSLTLRLLTTWQDKMHGYDEMIPMGAMPTSDPECYGGLKSRVMTGISYNLMNVLPVRGSIGAELGVPVYQNLNGPQMADKWIITSSLKISL